MTWEYEQIIRSQDQLDRAMTYYGYSGWELVAVLPHGSDYHLFFKRLTRTE